MGTERIVRGTWYFEVEGVWDVLPGSCLHHMNYFCARTACAPVLCELGAAKTFCLSSQRAASCGLHGRPGGRLETMRSVCRDLAALTGNVLGWCVGLAHELGIWVSCLNLTVCAGCYYVELCCSGFHFCCLVRTYTDAVKQQQGYQTSYL